MKKLDISKFNKVLIIRLSSFGDILLTTPFVRSLKNQYPKIEIDYILREEYSDLLRFNPYLKKIFKFKRDEKENLKTLSEIKKTNYDLIIDLQNNLRSKKIIADSNPVTVRFSKKTWRKFLLVKFKINHLKDAPQIPVRYAQTITGFQLDKNGLDLFTDRTADTRLTGKENLIGFCPGARHYTKRWLKEYYIKLGIKLTKAGCTIVLFGGSIDLELCAEISKEIPGSIDASTNDDILQTAADMKLCKAVVCNDSGLMHAAAASGTQVIAIFGSTVKEFGFTPYNCKYLILENKSLNCRPCTHIGRDSCPKKHFKCMKLIKPDFVFEQIISFIKE